MRRRPVARHEHRRGNRQARIAQEHQSHCPHVQRERNRDAEFHGMGPRQIRVLRLDCEDVVVAGEHEHRERQILGVVHRLADIARHAREKECGQPPGACAEEPRGHEAAEQNAHPAKHGVDHVADRPDVVRQDVLGRHRDVLDEAAVHAHVAEADVDGRAWNPAGVVVPELFAELLQRSLVPRGSEIQGQPDHSCQ